MPTIALDENTIKEVISSHMDAVLALIGGLGFVLHQLRDAASFLHRFVKVVFVANIILMKDAGGRSTEMHCAGHTPAVIE
jgi:hypothetical protein